MIYIFHGDHISLSRLALHNRLDISKQKGIEITTLDGDKITPPELESALSTTNLFTPTALLIENLLCRLRSRVKAECITLIVEYKGAKDIYLWEKKEVTKTTLTKFPHAQIKISKAPAVIFTFLDSLYPGNADNSLRLFHELCDTGYEPIVALTLIVRQINNLIQITDGKTPKVAPFQLIRLRSQARHWNLPTLITFHDGLLKIDYSIKTGSSSLTYADQLDILLNTLLR